VDIVDLEERNRACGMTLEEVEVGVARSVKLNLVSFGRGELDRRRLLEAQTESHHLLEQSSHRCIVLGRDTDPADVPDLHPVVLP
jgi:hypothetical protein